MNNELYNRIRLSLYGCALGDATGMVTEMWDQDAVKDYFPNGVDDLYASIDGHDFFGRHFQRGQVTDDTENTVFLIDTLNKCNGKIIAREFVDRIIEWEDNNPDTKNMIGPSTMKAIRSIRDGADINETGKFGTTNGASMKIAPVGIISDYRNLDELVQNVYQICLPTHNTSIAISGACAIAACVSYVVSGDFRNLDAMIEVAKEAAEKGALLGFRLPSASLIKRIDMALDIVRNNDEADSLKMIYEMIGTGMETIETVPAAIALMYLSEGNLEKVVRYCASIGGDTDTIGAICGSVCGPLAVEADEKKYKLLEEVNELDFSALAKSVYEYCPYR